MFTALKQRLRNHVTTASLVVVALLFAGFGVASALDADSSTSDASISTSPSPTPTHASRGGVTPASGGGGTVNNEVVVVNTTDDRFAHRSGFGVAHVTGDTAENQNAAAATSSCTDCRTVAVAVQVVLVQRTDASVISPRNLAVALNIDCLRCETFAAAYQKVITTDGLVRFTPGAQAELNALHAQIRTLAGTDGVAFPDLEAQIDALVEQMWAIVDQELVRVGGNPESRAVKDVDEALQDGASTSATPTSEPTSGAGTDEPTSSTPPDENETSPEPTPSGGSAEPSPSES